jgi:hypothetical protein
VSDPVTLAADVTLLLMLGGGILLGVAVGLLVAERRRR